MYKKFYLKTMLLLCALIVGYGSAWAEDVTTEVTLSKGTFTTDHITWSVDNAVTIQQLKGSSTNAVNSSYIAKPRVYKGHILAFEASTGYVIKSISIKCDGSYIGNSMTAGTEIVDNVVTDNTTDVTRTWTTTNGGTHVVSNTNGLSAIYIQNVATTTVQLRPTEITVTYASSGDTPLVATTTTIDATGITNTDVYVSTAAGSLSAMVKDADNIVISGAAVTWSSSDTSVATIASDGTVTLVGVGTTTITASYAGVTDEYQGSHGTYELTVTSSEPYVQPTEIEITPNYTFWGKTGQFSGNTYDALSGSKDNVTLEWSRGNGSTYANSTAMRFYKDNELTFTAPDGYEIKSIVLAVSETYNDLAFSPEGFDSETKTWTGSATTVTMSRPSNASGYAQISKFTITIGLPSTDPAISADDVNIAYDVTSGAITYTVDNGVDGGVVTASTTSDWLTLGGETASPISFTCGTNSETTARTAIVTLTYTYNTNETVTKDVTITQAAYEAPFESATYTLANSITSGKHYIIASSKANGAAQAMGAQASNNRTGADVTVSNNTIQTTSDVAEFVICGPDAKGNYTIYDAAEGGYLYAASSSSNHLKTQETLNDNGRWSISFGEDGEANIVAQGTSTRNTMQYNSNNSLFSCYASASQGAVYLYEKANEATPTQTVSITSAGMATFCSENALDFTGLTDMYAYIAQYNNDKVTYRKVTKVPARTGVLLRNPNGGDTSHEVPVLTGAADEVEGNKFIGTLTDITALASVDADETNTNYILNNGDNGVGFYKANNKKVGAGKAYLQLPTEGAKTFIGFDEEGEATAISTIDNGQLTMDNAYNLQGQKVGSEYKGIVIVNGKKFINK